MAEEKNMAEEKLVGKVVHFYGKAGVAIVELAEALSVGQNVRFKGASDNFTQTVSQLQFEHQDISAGKKGQQVGVKVEQKVREGVKVFAVE